MSEQWQRFSARGRLSRRRLLGAAGVASAAWLAACGGSNNDAKAKLGGASTSAPIQAGTVAVSGGVSNSAEQPKRGGKFVQTTTSSPPSNNAYVEFGGAVRLWGLNTYDRLFTVKFLKPYKLEAAQSIEQPDPLTVVIKLKPGMKFQNKAPVNGREVLAEDIVADRIYNRDLPNANQNNLERTGIDSIVATDKQTVTIKLKAPRAYLFSGTELGSASSNSIVPRELLDNLNTATPIGSGPYEQTSEGVGIPVYRYKRFEGFRDAAKGLPYVDEREVVIINDQSAMEAGFRSGQIDHWVTPTNTQAKKIGADMGNKVVVTKFLSPQTFTFNTNYSRAPWNDIRAREAMYRIVNRKQVLDLVWQSEGVLPYGLVSEALSDYKLTEAEGSKYYKNDKAEAKRLLEAAGFDFNKEYLVVMPTGQPLTNQTAEVVQQQMAEIGIKSRIRVASGAEWFVWVRDTGDFDVTYSNNPAFDTPQQMMRYNHTNTNFVVNYAGLKDPKFDAMVEDSERTTNPQELVKKIKALQIALLDAYTTMFPMNTYEIYHLHQAYVRNFESTPIISFVPDQWTEMWLAK